LEIDNGPGKRARSYTLKEIRQNAEGRNKTRNRKKGVGLQLLSFRLCAALKDRTEGLEAIFGLLKPRARAILDDD